MAKATKLADEKLDLEEIIEHQSEESNSYLNQVKDENTRKKCE